MPTAVAAAQPFVPTPAQLFGPLFVRVQMAALFEDGKEFPDAVPKAPPTVILRRYRAAAPRSRAALQQFVESNFSLPTQAHTPPALPQKSLEAHIAGLWPVLTRQPVVPPPYSSLLYVPKPYVVPGGRFREFYYWDSYFTMLGLIPDGHLATARDLVGRLLLHAATSTATSQRRAHVLPVTLAAADVLPDGGPPLPRSGRANGRDI